MLLMLAAFALGNPPADDWKTQEAAHLRNIRQLTRDFVRAGEGYFSPDGAQIVFQAEEKDTGNPFYQIFIMDLASGKVRRLSPGTGRTTCPYFAPDGKKIIFASSHLDPEAKKHQEAEYKQREEDRKSGRRRRCQCALEPCMDVFAINVGGTVLTQLSDKYGYDDD